MSVNTLGKSKVEYQGYQFELDSVQTLSGQYYRKDQSQTQIKIEYRFNELYQITNAKGTLFGSVAQFGSILSIFYTCYKLVQFLLFRRYKNYLGERFRTVFFP